MLMVALKKRMWVTREALQWEIASDTITEKLKREVPMCSEREKKIAFIVSEFLLKIMIL